MSKRDRDANAWEDLIRLRVEPDSDHFVDSLCKHLASKSGIVIGKAAAIGLERQSDLEPKTQALAPILAAAFERCMVNPVKTDPGCNGKIGIVNLGAALHCLEADLYLRAVRHVQMEGSYGPPIDTAEALRAAAVYGLLNCRHADAMHHIVQLLCEAKPGSDRFPDSTRGAIRALGTVVSDTSSALLRMMANQFGANPDVLTEVFASLNSIEAARSFDFVHGFLGSANADVADIAALALAESKQPRACPTLLEHARTYRGTDPLAPFTALAITRKPDALDYLLDRLANARDAESLAALDALRLMRHDPALVERVKSIVTARGGTALLRAHADWT